VWSLGVALGPLIIAYFLVDISGTRFLGDSSEFNITRPVEDVVASNVSLDHPGSLFKTSVMTGTAAMLDLYDNTVHNSTPPSHDVTIDVSMVRYAYVTIGSPMFLPAFAFLCVHLKRRRTPAYLSNSTGVPAYLSNGTGVELSGDHEEAGGSVKVKNCTKNEKMEKLPFISKMDEIVLVSLVVSFYVFYACLEIIPRGFLTTFTAKYLGWSTKKSTLINSIYSVCLFAGRLVGVPLSALLRPRSILAVNLLVILASSLFMLLAEWRDGLLVWPAAGLLGYGVSTTFGSK